MRYHSHFPSKSKLRLAVFSGTIASLMMAAGCSSEDQSVQSEPLVWSSAIVDQDSAWFETAQARDIADNVLQYQSVEGGWPKNVNMVLWPPAPKDANFATDGKANTFDNDATSVQMEFLARVYSVTGDSKYRVAFERGLNYTLKAQYPNGGWPQYYPLQEGYYTHITFNDDAMVRVMFLLKDIAEGKEPFKFVDDERRTKARQAIDKGLDVILRTQVKQNGRLTVWCAQYDENTLEPAWARAYEPPSLSGNESIGILRYLMSIEQPSPEVVAAIEAGVTWLQNAAIYGVRMEPFTDSEGRRDRRIGFDSTASPIWARFYELETDRPLFLGRDSVYRYAFSEIEHERRNGYSYYGYWPSELLKTDYPEWRTKHGL
jgi:PelA/Pel-15E family pectate lyase